MAAPGARALVYRMRINPAPVNAGLAKYPEHIEEKILSVCPDSVFIDASAEATALGNIRVANVILLGALSTSLAFPLAAWDEALENNVPKKAIAINLQAFRRGVELGKRQR